MNRSDIIALAAFLSAFPAMGQDLQQIADNLPIPETLAPGSRTLPMPKVGGVKVQILGADYSEIINNKGEVSRVIADTPVNISFAVSRGQEKVISRDYQVVVQPGNVPGFANPKPSTIPEILEWLGGKGEYRLGDTVSGDEAAVSILKEDIESMFGKKLVAPASGQQASIRLEKAKKSDALGKEGYTLTISPHQVIIRSATSRGLVWGIRTLEQILKQTGGSAPVGQAVDIPRYQKRGFILDIARTPHPLSYLKSVIRLMSWYKMNDLHLAINNNYIFHEDYVKEGKDPFKESYAAFRLESDVVGKDGTKLTASDLYYSKQDFADLVDFANKMGVDIVPELDAPGHALSFTRVRPDLIYQGPMNRHAARRCEMMDAANPETINFVGKVFDEYLQKDKTLGRAVFGKCPVIHVGADEFFGGAEEYRQYVDNILKFVLSRRHTPRVWGSLTQKQGKTPVQAKGVQMNLWNEGWSKPWDMINLGYDVINTNDADLYIVPFANYYRMDKRHQWIYNNWKVNRISKNVIPAGHPQLLGAAFAIWQDMMDSRGNAYSPYNIWNIISESTDMLGQKMWGKDALPRTYDEHRKLAKELGEGPGNNPLYRWKDKKPYTIEPKELPASPACEDTLGPDYKLTLDVQLDKETPGEVQTLLSGGKTAGALLLLEDGTLGFRRDDSYLFSFGYKLPVGKRVKLELIGTLEKTELLVDGQPAGEIKLLSHKHRADELLSPFVLPLQTIGASWNGKVFSMTVEPR